MVFLLRKKATATSKAVKENEAAAKLHLHQQQQALVHAQQAAAASAANAQFSTASHTPKVVNGEALSAMSIQYDSDRIKQAPTYAPSTAASSTSNSTSTTKASLSSAANNAAGPAGAASSAEPIDQLLAREAYEEDESRKGSTSTTKPSPAVYRRTSSAHADITAHSQTLPPVHNSVASTSSTYYPSTTSSSSSAAPSNSYYASANTSSSSYGYYRSPETDKHARGSVSSESSYAASETSDILHNSVGGRSSSGGTTATTPGSTMDKESYSSQRKNSLIAQSHSQPLPQSSPQAQSSSSGRPTSIERVPVPSASSSAALSSTRPLKTRPEVASTLTTPESIQNSPALSSTSSFARKTASRYTLTDFQFQRTLGTGSFGRVHLVRSCHNMRFYAVKVLNKERVVRMKQVEHTNSEREMLERVRHPFLVNLWGTFKDSQNLYMVMDFVSGGELFSLLRKSQVSFRFRKGLNPRFASPADLVSMHSASQMQLPSSSRPRWH